ncbi:MAG: TIGR00268 family protein [Candidatus Aegiribacteria sp.]|nr:TIGR00268 family protein [Candidatus Aegiribacteria sp.]
MSVPEILKQSLLDKGCCGTLFSGGYDSEVLLRSAVRVIGASNVVPLTADTELLAGFYRRHILSVAEELCVEPLFVPLDPLSCREFARNTDMRCYICKKGLYTSLKAEALARGCITVMDGTNTDDLNEYRPGLAAAAETGIAHPFLEACMGRSDITELGVFLGVREYPSDSCLATRIPRGQMITSELLTLIESMEAPLRPSVKGRFRVIVGTGSLHINYSVVDEKLVENNLGQLKRIAEKSGHEIELHRLDT